MVLLPYPQNYAILLIDMFVKLNRQANKISLQSDASSRLMDYPTGEGGRLRLPAPLRLVLLLVLPNLLISLSKLVYLWPVGIFCTSYNGFQMPQLVEEREKMFLASANRLLWIVHRLLNEA